MLTNQLLDYRNEIKRKKFHLLSIFIPIFYILYPDGILYFVFLLSLILLTIDFFRIFSNSKLNTFYEKFLKDMTRGYESKRPMTATYLVLTSFFIILFFNKEFSILAISIVSICDAMAAIFGMKYGTIKILHNKTLEGSLAFMISGLMIIFILTMILSFKLDIMYLIFILIISCIVEAITPGKYDNISTPISISIISSIFMI